MNEPAGIEWAAVILTVPVPHVAPVPEMICIVAAAVADAIKPQIVVALLATPATAETVAGPLVTIAVLLQ
jgi:hypothetical protein